jgi:hypothetical protein
LVTGDGSPSGFYLDVSLWAAQQKPGLKLLQSG